MSQISGPVSNTVEPNLAYLKGKSVIITGGSSGLGEAYVKAFVAAGAYVTNADINPPKDASHTESKNYQYVRCDVRSWSDQLAVFKAALSHSPSKGIDIVIANAGIAAVDEIFELDEGDEPKEPPLNVVKVNFIGYMYTTKLALHYFNKSKSTPDQKCLIIKGSMAGYIDLLGAPQYQTSKYAVRGLMCNLRAAGRCRVNLIAPWYIKTPIMPDEIIAMVDAQLKSQGQEWAVTEDSVKAVLRVACDESINGRTLGVMPKNLYKEGYVDLELDEHKEGSILHPLGARASNWTEQ